MKKGFTLIELLGIITILGLILIVAIPMLIESNRVASANEKEDIRENVKIAAEDYVSSCASLGSCAQNCSYEEIMAGRTCTLQVDALISNGFLRDTEDNRKIGSVTVSLKNGEIEVD